MKKCAVACLLSLAAVAMTGCVVVGRGTKIQAGCAECQAVGIDGNIYLVNVHTGRVTKIDPVNIQTARVHIPEDIEVRMHTEIDTH